jgi:hypothetical protein
MTTKRRKVPPRRRAVTPAWAERLLAGEKPTEGDGQDWHDFFAWMFCDLTVEGLPDSDSPEGRKLWRGS